MHRVVRRGVIGQSFSSFDAEKHKDYHEVSDEVERLDFAHMEACVRASQTAVSLVARGELVAQRTTGDEAVARRERRTVAHLDRCAEMDAEGLEHPFVVEVVLDHGADLVDAEHPVAQASRRPDVDHRGGRRDGEQAGGRVRRAHLARTGHQHGQPVVEPGRLLTQGDDQQWSVGRDGPSQLHAAMTPGPVPAELLGPGAGSATSGEGEVPLAHRGAH